MGFSLVGVTTSDPLLHGNVFLDWLGQGRHGEMAYLNSPRSRACRPHPGQILAGCRSVLVLGVRYPAPQPPKSISFSSPILRGRVAAYAWGEDYHTVLTQRLKHLVAFIESQVGYPIPNRWYTDTGPLLERELAQRAGLGWIGKNTCLINPTQGSYFLLAEILLGIELEPGQPFTRDACGTCTRCLAACPTGCILPNRTLDARRCISYLTIELKGSIPYALRPLISNWVFGCDVCQQVCPWNRFANKEVDPAFEPHLVDPEPDLLEALVLPAGEFNSRNRNNPLMRTKRKGYLRNIAVALGNSHRQEAVMVLDQALTHEHEPLVRAHAAWALGQIGGAHANQTLKSAAKHEHDPMVLSEIQTALVNQ